MELHLGTKQQTRDFRTMVVAEKCLGNQIRELRGSLKIHDFKTVENISLVQTAFWENIK